MVYVAPQTRNLEKVVLRAVSKMRQTEPRRRRRPTFDRRMAHGQKATSMTEDSFDFEGSAQHLGDVQERVIRGQMTVENVD
jgi:hypothetical protein